MCIQCRSKRKFELGRTPALTKIGERKIRVLDTKSSTPKAKLLVAKVANLFDPKTKTYHEVAIKIVTANPANRHYVRQNIITRGAIIETDKGKARVTSRPGQDGAVNAVLV
jgi:small subunit ribosomal protein S8e